MPPSDPDTPSHADAEERRDEASGIRPRAQGTVALVGAGPGDPALLTMRGAELLRACGAVVFDALANPILLDMAPSKARRVDVGKRAGFHKKTQDETNQILVDLAREGLDVVRLKGGDPYLFGRGGEEAAYCAAHGVKVEIVPGVTAGIAAPATAGIPVTHRGLASSVTFITGHEDPIKVAAQGGELSVDYDALAALIKGGGTLCIYMGVSRLASIAQRLTEGGGLPRDTPAALVQWGTLPQQRHARGTLETLPGVVERQGLSSPAIVVIGPVAGLEGADAAGLDWFIKRPLYGRRVLVTRSSTQASTLRSALLAQGAEVIEAPTIAIAPSTDPQPLLDALVEWPRFAWVLLTSANAVDALAEGLNELGLLDPRRLAGPKIGVVGEATAAALYERFRIRPDVKPDRANARALGDAVLSRHAVKGEAILLPQADQASGGLAEMFEAEGADVTSIEAYRIVPVARLEPATLEALKGGQVDVATFTSGSTARNLLDMLGDDASELLASVKLVTIGPTASGVLTDAGLTVAAEADEPSIDALVQAVTRSIAS